MVMAIISHMLALAAVTNINESHKEGSEAFCFETCLLGRGSDVRKYEAEAEPQKAPPVAARQAVFISKYYFRSV